MKVKLLQEEIWPPVDYDLLGDLEVHYCGFNPNCGVLCDCWQVDPTLRLSPDAQLDAILKADLYCEYQDPADLWPEHWT